MFYVFHGDDKHAIDRQLAELQERMGDRAMLDLNTSRFQGAGLSLSELQHACDSVPFLGDKRLVVVTDLVAARPAFMDELLAYLPDLPATTRLVFLEHKSLPKNHPLVSLADQSGYVRQFKRLEGASLEKWIRDEVAARGGQIAHRAAHLLALNVGNDLYMLEMEIEKLVLYKGGEMIEADDVSLLCPYVAEASIFDLVDAMGTRNGQTAAQLLQKKLEEGVDPAFLFAMMVRQYRLLIMAAELAEAGHRAQEIAQALKIHPFVAGKVYGQSRTYSLEQLTQIYRRLLEIDVEVKTSQTDMVTALTLLVAGVAM
jgi:DNA polymerase III subunit delta